MCKTHHSSSDIKNLNLQFTQRNFSFFNELHENLIKDCHIGFVTSDEGIGKKFINGTISRCQDINSVYIMREIHVVSNYSSVDINLYYSSAASESSNLCLELETDNIASHGSSKNQHKNVKFSENFNQMLIS